MSPPGEREGLPRCRSTRGTPFAAESPSAFPAGNRKAPRRQRRNRAYPQFRRFEGKHPETVGQDFSAPLKLPFPGINLRQQRAGTRARGFLCRYPIRDKDLLRADVREFREDVLPRGEKGRAESPVEMSQKESPKPPSSPATHARKLLLFDSRFSESRTAPGVRTLTTFLSTIPFARFGSPICSQTATFFPLARSFDMWGSALWNGTRPAGQASYQVRFLSIGSRLCCALP